jgi:hypothetical protein
MLSLAELGLGMSGMTPEDYEMGEFLAKLQEAMMWWNAGIARRGVDKAGRRLALPPLPSGVAVQESSALVGCWMQAVNKRGPLVLMDTREPKDLQAKMLKVRSGQAYRSASLNTPTLS